MASKHLDMSDASCSVCGKGIKKSVIMRLIDNGLVPVLGKLTCYWHGKAGARRVEHYNHNHIPLPPAAIRAGHKQKFVHKAGR